MGQNNKKKKKNNNKKRNTSPKTVNNKNISNQNNVQKKEVKKTTPKVDINNDKKIEKLSKIDQEKFICIILFIVIIMFILLNSILSERKVENNNDDQVNIEEPQKERETILLLGDSLFYQYNVEDFFSYYDYNIINSSRNGITAYETLNNIEEKVYQYNPTKVFILLGTNDLHFEFTPYQTFEHLKGIIEGIKKYNDKTEVYAISLLPINTTGDGKIDTQIYIHRSNEKINEVNKYLREYCREENIPYINIHDRLIDENDQFKLEYTSEGLHLTDLGYYHLTMYLVKYFE